MQKELRLTLARTTREIVQEGLQSVAAVLKRSKEVQARAQELRRQAEEIRIQQGRRQQA